MTDRPTSAADCPHEQIITYRFDDGRVAMWGCLECRMRFSPGRARQPDSELRAALELGAADDIGPEATLQRADVMFSMLRDRLEPEQAEQFANGIYEPLLEGMYAMTEAAEACQLDSLPAIVRAIHNARVDIVTHRERRPVPARDLATYIAAAVLIARRYSARSSRSASPSAPQPEPAP